MNMAAMVSICVALILFFAAGVVSPVLLSDLLTIQPGSTYGGCDGRLNVLEDWHEEAIDSLDSAIDAIDDHYNEDSENGKRVRTAMF
jgi:hypothetical protein